MIRLELKWEEISMNEINDYTTQNSQNNTYPTLNEYLNNIKTDYTYNPFILIKNYITSDIIPIYENLASCKMFKEDEEGNEEIEYYIKFVGNLSFSERKQLHYTILEKIKEFLYDMGFIEEFKEISIFLIK